MPLTPPLVPPGMRFAHVTWGQVTPMVAETWGDGSDKWQRRVTDILLAALESLGGSWTTWRAEQLGEQSPATREPEPNAAERPGVLEVALALAETTAGDGRQRAVDHPWADLEDLQQPRVAIR